MSFVPIGERSAFGPAMRVHAHHDGVGRRAAALLARLAGAHRPDQPGARNDVAGEHVLAALAGSGLARPRAAHADHVGGVLDQAVAATSGA